MRIDKNTKTEEILPLLNYERVEQILKEVPAHPLKKKVIAMTVGEYVQALEPSFAMQFLKKKRAFKAFGMLKEYRKEMEEIGHLFEINSVQPTPEDRAALRGVVLPSVSEGLLLEAFEGFRLSRIDGMNWLCRMFGRYGAADIPLAELLVLHKKTSAAAMVEANKAASLRRKNNNKK